MKIEKIRISSAPNTPRTLKLVLVENYLWDWKWCKIKAITLGKKVRFYGLMGERVSATVTEVVGNKATAENEGSVWMLEQVDKHWACMGGWSLRAEAELQRMIS
jgi:hypothetical protein